MSKSKKLFFENSRRKLSELAGADWNPRQLTKKQADDLKKSLQKFDLAEVPVVNLDGMIIAGHQRTKILSQLHGDIEIDVRIPSRLMTEDEVKEYNVRSNKNTGEWDFDLLANNFELEELLDWGFTEEELKLDLEPEVIEGNTDEDEVPEAPERPITVAGDVWLLGGHRLMCGDSTSIDAVEKLMGGKKADMVFTDPPYGIAIVKNNRVGGGGAFGGKKNEAKGAKRIEVHQFEPIIGDETTNTAIDAFNLCAALEIPVMIFWGANHYSEALPSSSCWIVWDKENTGNFADGELAWTNQTTAVRIFKHMWNGMVKASERGESRVHPTQKPIALAEWAFNQYGKESDVVLDLFLGSGSTLIACEKTNRICYGMELAAAYCDVIINRWQNFTGKQATHAETGLTFDEHKAGLPANSV